MLESKNHYNMTSKKASLMDKLHKYAHHSIEYEAHVYEPFPFLVCTKESFNDFK